MSETDEQLSLMDNPQEMWTLFSTSFRDAVEKFVPIETIRVPRDDQTPWFNKHVEKLLNKQRRSYDEYKRSFAPYFFTKHKEQRRQNKRELKEIKKIHSREGLQTSGKRK